MGIKLKLRKELESNAYRNEAAEKKSVITFALCRKVLKPVQFHA